MKKLILTALGGLALASGPAANAATVIFADGDPLFISPGETLVNDFNLGGTATVVPTGSGFIYQTGSNSDGAQPAFGDGSRYLSVLGGGSATFTFASALSSFGFDLGSADTYNLVTLLFSGGGSQDFTGQDIIDVGTADGDQSSPRTNGRATFTASAGQTITGFRLASSQNSLEVDNLAVGSVVPEPATWGLMLAGFGAVGYSLRARGTRRRPAQAV